MKSIININYAHNVIFHVIQHIINLPRYVASTISFEQISPFLLLLFKKANGNLFVKPWNTLIYILKRIPRELPEDL